MNRKESNVTTKKNSIQEMQLRLEVEELQANLVKSSNLRKSMKTTNRSQEEICNYSISNSNRNFNKSNRSEKDNLNSNIKIPNDNDNDRDKENTTMHEVLRKMLDIKKTNKFISRDLLDKKISIDQKEKIIIQLIDEIKFYIKENSQLEKNLEDTTNLRNECEINRNGVEEFCKNLKIKFKIFVAIIDSYEDKIKILKKDRDQIVSINDSIIEMKNNDRRNITIELDKTNSRLEFNAKSIKELETNNESLIKEKEDQKNKFEENEIMDKVLYAELERKYVDMFRRAKDFQFLEEIRENEVVEAQDRTVRENWEKTEREIKLKDYQLMNEILEKQLEDTNNKLYELTMRSNNSSSPLSQTTRNPNSRRDSKKNY